MVKVLLSVLLAAFVAVPITARDWADVVEKTLKSVVYIETEEGSCTGFVIDKSRKLVATAAHCDGKSIYIDNVNARIVSKDTKKDLAVFEVKDLDPERPALKLASKNPTLGEDVVSIGYGMGLETPMVRRAMISDVAMNIPNYGIGGPYIALDSAFVGGQSGGPVVNSKGEVVMMVQMASNSVGIGVGAEIMKEKIGRFWSN